MIGRVAGATYFVLGAALLLTLLTVCLPLGEARIAFDRMRAEALPIDTVSTTVRSLMGSSVEAGDSKVISEAIAKLGLPPATAAIVARWGEQGSAYRQLETRARAQYELRRTATVNSITTDGKPPTKSALKEPDLPADMPVSAVFRTYLRENHEALAASWIANQWLALEAWEATLYSFVCLGFAFGFLGGCIRLFGIGKTNRSSLRNADLVWPLATPVLAIFFVMMLTGFGTVFKSGVDPATSKFLIVLVAAIALSPEVFLVAIRRYLSDLLSEFSADGKAAQSG